MKRLLPLSALVLALVSTGVAAQDAQSIARGKEKSAVCAACHMPDGRGQLLPGTEARPRITGLAPEYFVRQLQAYKDGSRNNATMQPMAAMLSDDDMKDVANYFASLPVVHDQAPPPADEELKAWGERLITKGDWSRFIPACAQCHGPNAGGLGSSFPNLNGQSAEYTKQQIMAWKNGTRNNDLLGLMKPVAERLSEKDIEAVAAWFAAQPAVPPTADKKK